jgi:hypothetical protein
VDEAAQTFFKAGYDQTYNRLSHVYVAAWAQLGTPTPVADVPAEGTSKELVSAAYRLAAHLVRRAALAGAWVGFFQPNHMHRFVAFFAPSARPAPTPLTPELHCRFQLARHSLQPVGYLLQTTEPSEVELYLTEQLNQLHAQGYLEHWPAAVEGWRWAKAYAQAAALYARFFWLNEGWLGVPPLRQLRRLLTVLVGHPRATGLAPWRRRLWRRSSATPFLLPNERHAGDLERQAIAVWETQVFFGWLIRGRGAAPVWRPTPQLCASRKQTLRRTRSYRVAARRGWRAGHDAFREAWLHPESIRSRSFLYVRLLEPLWPVIWEVTEDFIARTGRDRLYFPPHSLRLRLLRFLRREARYALPLRVQAWLAPLGDRIFHLWGTPLRYRRQFAWETFQELWQGRDWQGREVWQS